MMRRWQQASQQSKQNTDIARWRDFPTVFAEECFGIKPWSKQAEFMQAVVYHHRVAVRSGHKVSKSNAAALLAYWWAITRPGAKVICTSSSHRQVRDILWGEITALALRAESQSRKPTHVRPNCPHFQAAFQRPDLNGAHVVVALPTRSYQLSLRTEGDRP